MKSGFLDLLQRQLVNAVIHPVESYDALTGIVGAEGQIASTEGSFYIYTADRWQRITNETDLALLRSEVGRAAVPFSAEIPAKLADRGVFSVPHGFHGRPVVEVTGPDGSVLGVEVVHYKPGACLVVWKGVLPSPALVTCVGQPLDGGRG